MLNIKSLLPIICGLLITSTNLYSQTIGGSQTNGSESNNVITAVPFLLIVPDARSGAMGNVGVATPGDANSSGMNPAKMAFLENDYSIGLSYSPWLRNIASDVSLSYLSGYYKLDERNTIGASLRYFSLGNVQLTDANQQLIGVTNPNELAFDISYSRSFGDDFALGGSVRYINSNLQSNLSSSSTYSKAGNAVAIDIGALYTKKTILFNTNTILATGINFSNIGTKMSYTQSGTKFFLPSNLRIGGSAKFLLDDINDLTFAIDFNKILAPTQPFYDVNGNIIAGKDPNRSVTSALFSSFSDAPGGFSEEIKEIGISTGVEYWYNNTFALRAGYNFENPEKGNNSYLTVGAGVRYNKFNFDFGYLVADAKKSPLAKTMRFGLIYNY